MISELLVTAEDEGMGVSWFLIIKCDEKDFHFKSVCLIYFYQTNVQSDAE